MTLHEVCGHLLPPQAFLHLDTIALQDQCLILDVAVTTPQATCLDCTQLSTHVHSPTATLICPCFVGQRFTDASETTGPHHRQL